MGLRIMYNNVDITQKVQIISCVHDMYAESKSDSLFITFGDSAGKWDAWHPVFGDVITVADGAAKTGQMFLVNVLPGIGQVSLHALSAPTAGYIPKSRAWETVTLYRIISDIADAAGLAYELHGTSDQQYGYIPQQEESDFSFLDRLLMYESCAFLVYDGKLVCYSEPYIESQPPALVIDVTSDIRTKAGFDEDLMSRARSMRVESGVYFGEYSIEEPGIDLVVESDIQLGSDADGYRFARGLLRSQNKNLTRGWIKRDLTPSIAAGTVAMIRTDNHESWNGPVFVSHIRNEYISGKSKIFFRRVLEGY